MMGSLHMSSKEVHVRTRIIASDLLANSWCSLSYMSCGEQVKPESSYIVANYVTKVYVEKLRKPHFPWRYALAIKILS